MSTNRDDDRDETFDDDSLQRADAYDDSHELPLPLPPLLGLDGKPVEITDEKLHELIDAMSASKPVYDFGNVQLNQIANTDADEFMIAQAVLSGVGQIEFSNVQTGEVILEPAVILHISYKCDKCDNLHLFDIALRALPEMTQFFHDTAEVNEQALAMEFPDGMFGDHQPD